MAELDTVKVLVGKLRERLTSGGISSYEEYHTIFLEFLGKPASLEVKSHGEVYTPLSLIQEMLDKLPVEVWLNPSLMWFEPACGLAPFLYCVYHRLMAGLTGVIGDESERRRHILETMLYFNEIQPKNLELMKVLFNAGEYRLNIFEGDGLKVVPSSFRADIIVGNPPYNDGSGNKGKGHTLWTKFVEQSLTNWLTPSGHLLFVTPALWRQFDHPLQNIMKAKQIVSLDIYNEQAGLRTFKCNTRYDVYLIKNEPYTTPTIIKSEDESVVEVDIRRLAFVPNYHYELLLRLTSKSQKVQILHSESSYEVRKNWMSHIKEGDYKYPCVYSINKQNVATYKWSSRTDKGMFGVPKLIFGGGATGFLVDANGDYGLTQWATGIVDEVENLEAIRTCLESKNFQSLKLAMSVSKVEINRKILAQFNNDFWRELSSLELFPLVVIEDKCQAVTTTGKQCTRKKVECDYCTQHSKSGSSSVQLSSAKADNSAGSSSANLDCRRLADSIGKKGYTVDQLKSYARERNLVFKSTATKNVLRELLLASC